MTVCNAHGGRAPQVRDKARQRIMEAADPVAAALIKIALDEKQDTAHRITAARDLLDRAGYGAKQALEIASDLHITDDRVDQARTLAEMIESERAKLQARQTTVRRLDRDD
jgi:hypothetical protein